MLKPALRGFGDAKAREEACDRRGNTGLGVWLPSVTYWPSNIGQTAKLLWVPFPHLMDVGNNILLTDCYEELAEDIASRMVGIQ